IAAKRLVSYGKKKPSNTLNSKTTSPIIRLNITMNNPLFAVCLYENLIDRLIHHKFNVTAVKVANVVATIDPRPAINLIRKLFKLNLTKNPAPKLTNEKRCSFTPCKIAAVTVNKAKPNATGLYHINKRPDISK